MRCWALEQGGGLDEGEGGGGGVGGKRGRRVDKGERGGLNTPSTTLQSIIEAPGLHILPFDLGGG